LSYFPKLDAEGMTCSIPLKGCNVNYHGSVYWNFKIGKHEGKRSHRRSRHSLEDSIRV